MSLESEVTGGSQMKKIKFEGIYRDGRALQAKRRG